MSNFPTHTRDNSEAWLLLTMRDGHNFLSTQLLIASDARATLAEGSFVKVIFDDNTWNALALRNMLVSRGWFDFASEVYMMLQLGLDDNSDWSTIVQDADLMRVIWANESKRNLVLNSASIMGLVVGSGVARTTLLAEPDAFNRAWQINNSASILSNNAYFVSEMVAIPARWNTAVSTLNIISRLCGNDTTWGIISATQARMFNIIDSQNAMTAVGNNPVRCLRPIANDPTLRSRVESSPAATTGLSLCSTIITSPEAQRRQGGGMTVPINTPVTLPGLSWVITGSLWIDREVSLVAGVAMNTDVSNLLSAPTTINSGMFVYPTHTSGVNSWWMNRFGNNTLITPDIPRNAGTLTSPAPDHINTSTVRYIPC
jgi:hypothetical protein